ncbi:MAG: glycosyltransferase family 39 protein, partial [Patescibacteria group bacterium]
MNKIIIVIIFIFAFGLRLWNLNEMGRTWDEYHYIEHGYKMIELLKKGDFNNPFFYTSYDHPPLVKYMYGAASYFDIESIDERGNPVFYYDFTYSRLLSAFVSSISIILVVIIGWHISSRFVGISAGIILATLPLFLGLSQLVTTESFIMLSFSSSFLSFLLLLKKFSIKKVIITGLLVGLSLQVKQSNFLLFPLFGFMYLVWYWRDNKNRTPFLNKRF